MILLIDTSTATCKIWLVDSSKTYAHEWEAGRSLARDLLAYLRDRLREHETTFADISGIGMFLGPGSFTGLRIGMTVMNTLAAELHVPIVGATGDDWRAATQKRLAAGESDEIVVPEYGGEANITKPRK